MLDSDDPEEHKIDAMAGGAMHSEMKLNPNATPPEFLGFALGTEGYNLYFENESSAHPHIFSWLSPTMNQFGRMAVANGCGMHRPFGRLCFFHHFGKIEKAIRDHLQSIIQAAANAPAGEGWRPPGTNATTDPRRLEVIIVHSVAGGTGAGMFVDVNFLVRKIIDDNYRGMQTHVTDIAVLPGMLRTRNGSAASRPMASGPGECLRLPDGNGAL